jgi:hypothetical protein
MEITYKIEAADFLDFQLYTASKSKRIMKKKKTEWILLTVSSLVLGLYFYFLNNMAMTKYFGLTTVLCWLFYPRYFNWRYKKYFKDFVNEHFQKRFGEIERIKFTREYIYTIDKTGEGKINTKELEEVSETKKHFIFKISTGLSLIIPKREIDDLDLFKIELNGIGIKTIDELSWE